MNMSGSCECGGVGASTQPSLRESAYDMVRVEDAVRMVLEQAEPLEVEMVKVPDALGRVVAEPVVSSTPLPPFRASIMDGYAVVASDGVGEFPVINRIAAGDAPTNTITPGHVAYITTGAPVPEGADAVVKIEDTDGIFADSGAAAVEVGVKIHRAVTTGQNVRAIGADMMPGEELIAPHEVVTPAEIGLLATAGVTEVTVFRQPIVGVLSTGSELVEPFASVPTPSGKIRDSNRPMLLGLLASWSITARDLGICHDQKKSLEATVRAALDHVDVLITSGGVSMGEHDLIKPLLGDLGTVHFGRLLMKPGKPTTFATLTVNGRKKLVFALPGNPVSAFTTSHLLVRPALKRLQGFPADQCRQTQVYATLAHSVRLDPERPEYHRATVSWDVESHKLVAVSTGKRQASSRLLSCRQATALLCLPTGTDIRAGDAVSALLLDDTLAQAQFHAIRVQPVQSGVAAGPVSTPPVNVAPSTTAPQASSSTSVKVFRAGLLTISDRVSSGESKDLSGPAMADALEGMATPTLRVQVVATAVVPDEADQIQAVVSGWTDTDAMDLILTSGGTGFSPRDVTPEAIKAILHKETPGFVITMLETSRKITPKAILSRPVAGIRARTLIITLPGKPKAVSENLAAIDSVLAHALHLVRDQPHEHHRANPALRYT